MQKLGARLGNEFSCEAIYKPLGPNQAPADAILEPHLYLQEALGLKEQHSLISLAVIADWAS